MTTDGELRATGPGTTTRCTTRTCEGDVLASEENAHAARVAIGIDAKQVANGIYLSISTGFNNNTWSLTFDRSDDHDPAIIDTER